MLLRLKVLHLGMSGDITFVVLNFRDKKKGKKEFSVQILPCLAFCPADAVIQSESITAIRSESIAAAPAKF